MRPVGMMRSDANEPASRTDGSLLIESLFHGTTFVRGGTILPASEKTYTPAVAPTPEVYVAPLRQRLFHDEEEEDVEEIALPERLPDPEEQAKAAITLKKSARKQRQMDLYREEMRREHQAAAAAAGHTQTSGRNCGSYDYLDTATTTLHLSNLHPVMNRHLLCRIFGACGAIGAVRVFEPDSLEDAQEQRYAGVITFMHRRDAELALESLNGASKESVRNLISVGLEFHGRAIRVSWSKAIPLPKRPIYLHNPVMPAPLQGMPFHAELCTPLNPDGRLVCPGKCTVRLLTVEFRDHRSSKCAYTFRRIWC